MGNDQISCFSVNLSTFSQAEAFCLLACSLSINTALPNISSNFEWLVAWNHSAIICNAGWRYLANDGKVKMAQILSVIFVDNSLCHLKESRISDFVNKANLAYFGGLLTDQDKTWAQIPNTQGNQWKGNFFVSYL